MATQISFGPRFHPRSAAVTFWVIVASAVSSLVAFLVSGSAGAGELFANLFVFSPSEALSRPWSLVLYPLLNVQSPFWFLLLAYVMWWCGSDLEHWWGAKVQAGFLLAVTIAGGLMACLAAALRPDAGGVLLSGAGILMESLLCAWGLRNPTRQVILIILPVTGLVIAVIAFLGVWFNYGVYHGFFIMLGTTGLAALYVTRGEHFHRFLRRFEPDKQAKDAKQRDQKFQRIMAKSGLHLVDDDDDEKRASH